MKNFKRIVLFLLIFFIGQWIISSTLSILVSKSSFRFSKLYNKSNIMDNDIVCFGNSRAISSFYAPFINKKYPVKAFNMSYNGVKFELLDIFFNDYLDNHNKPKIVFIEISALFNEKELNPLSFNMYSSESDKIEKAIKAYDNKTHLLNFLFPLYKYNNELLYRSMFYFNKSDQDWLNRYTISKELKKRVKESDVFDFEIEPKDILLLNGMIERMKNEKIQFQLYLCPYLPSYLEKIKNFENQIEYIQKETGEIILDFSDFLKEDQYFADRVHVNDKAAEIISDKLMNSIHKE